jgi:hypothetical protein
MLLGPSNFGKGTRYFSNMFRCTTPVTEQQIRQKDKEMNTVSLEKHKHVKLETFNNYKRIVPPSHPC